jgi:hypothetical protein
MVEEDAFVELGINILKGYLLQDQILQFIRMLMIEQHVNEEAADLYHHTLFESPLKHNAEVFQVLIQMGCFRNADVHYMAIEYYSPIFFIFQRYFSCDEITAKKLEKAVEELTVHLKKFYERYNLSHH